MLLVAASFGATASTNTISSDIGSTSSLTVGTIAGVESYSSTEASESSTANSYSYKEDNVNGVKNIAGGYGSVSNEVYATNTLDLNGAEFSATVKSGTYAHGSVVAVSDSSVTNGFEIDDQWSGAGWSSETSNYNGSFANNSVTATTGAGVTASLHTEWYE